MQSSLHALRTSGFYEAYLRVLPPEYHEAILGTLTATWLPIESGLAHYATCDALSIDNDELMVIGGVAGDRIQGPFIKTLAAAARSAGVTPWTIFRRWDVLWDRLFRGGGFELTKVGPKEVVIRVCSLQLPRYKYFRNALCGVVQAGFKFVGVGAAHVKVIGWDAAADQLVMRAAWV